MKKLVALLLACSFVLTACVPQKANVEATPPAETSLSAPAPPAETSLPAETSPSAEAPFPLLENQQFPEEGFTGLEDPALRRYFEDSIYEDIVSELDDDYFFVENISTVYLSKEYLDELAYNSQENIYFGYTLSELFEQFQGEKFIFTLGENGQTVVKAVEGYDDTYNSIIRNVAIGAGVILLCVTVSAVTAGMGAPALSVIFAASAKTATSFALSGGLIGGVTAGIFKGIETKDFDQALKAAALGASEGFMWGAITGAVMGGAQSAIALKGATLNGLTMDQAAMIQKESKYPLDVIKEFKSVEQYNICKEAGLTPRLINGKTVLIPKNLDLNFIDEFGNTNLQRLSSGLNPIDPKTGLPYEWHHIGQKVDSTLALLTKAEHMQGGNDLIWHNKDIESAINRNAWNKERKILNEMFANLFGG